MTVDDFIARKNIEVYWKTGSLDYHYLEELSYDAVPAMAGLVGVEDDYIGVKAQAYFMKIKEKLEHKKWQEFNYSEYKALQSIESVLDGSELESKN